MPGTSVTDAQTLISDHVDAIVVLTVLDGRPGPLRSNLQAFRWSVETSPNRRFSPTPTFTRRTDDR